MVFENGALMWGKIVLSWIISAIVIFSSGLFTMSKLNIRKRMSSAFLWGCITICALCEIVYLFCICFSFNFNIFFITNTFLIVLCCLLGLFELKKDKVHFRQAVDNKLYIFLMLVMASILLYSVIFTRWGGASDDEYYLGKAGEIIRSNVLNPTFPDAAYGNDEKSNYLRADVSSLIVIYSYISRAFQIHPVVTARTFFSPIIILLGISVVICLADAKEKKEKEKNLVALFSCALLLALKNGGSYQEEYYYVVYPWYGIVLLSLLSCVFVSLIMELYDNEKVVYDKKFWIKLLLVNLAILQSEIVGVFIIPCLYVIYGLPYLLSERKNIGKIIVGSIVSLIPEVICALYVLFSYFGAEVQVGQNEGKDWGNNIYGYFLWGTETTIRIYFILYATACLYFLFRGNKKEKGIIAFPALMLFATFANPLLFGVVTRYITTQAVYYRLFFCLPVFFVIGCFLARLFYLGKKEHKAIMILLLSVYFIFGVKKIFSAEMINNPYKAPQISEEIINELLSDRKGDKVKIMPMTFSSEIRIYCDNIIYSCGRYSSTMPIENTCFTYISLYEALQKGNKEAIEVLKELDTDYILYEKDAKLPDCIKDNPTKKIGNYLLVNIAK